MMQTWPSWEAYERYLRDERNRERDAERWRAESRAIHCEHGRNLLQRCVPCEQATDNYPDA